MADEAGIGALEAGDVTEAAQGTRRLRTSQEARARQRDIVRRAAELFEEVGYHRASMDDLAEAVGLAKPTLYYYFSGKEEILFRIHEEFIALLISRQEKRATGLQDAADELLEVMADILELMQTHHGHVRVFFEHHREIPEKWHGEIVAQRQRYQGMVEDVIRRGMRTEEFREADVRMTSLAVFGMCNWAYQWYRPDGPLEPREIARFFLDLIGNGLFASGLVDSDPGVADMAGPQTVGGDG